MWFRRRRRRQSPPLVLLPSLDRLAELVARVIALLDEAVPAEPAAPAEPAELELAAGHVLFVADPAGYRLLQREGPPPARGDALVLEGLGCHVVRLGPSPLPGDRRRCAFLEREEPPRPERSFDG
jgi:hypothetical protein